MNSDTVNDESTVKLVKNISGGPTPGEVTPDPVSGADSTQKRGVLPQVMRGMSDQQRAALDARVRDMQRELDPLSTFELLSQVLIKPVEPEVYRLKRKVKALASGAKSLLHFYPPLDVVAKQTIHLAEIHLNVLSLWESGHRTVFKPHIDYIFGTVSTGLRTKEAKLFVESWKVVANQMLDLVIAMQEDQYTKLRYLVLLTGLITYLEHLLFIEGASATMPFIPMLERTKTYIDSLEQEETKTGT